MRAAAAAQNVMHLFTLCHAIVATGTGGLSIYLQHLPFPGTVIDQPWKLMQAFLVVRAAMYKHAEESLRRTN